jgi:hypothetical protein
MTRTSSAKPADAIIEPLPGPFLDFLDPCGGRIEIVGYDNIKGMAPD